MRHHVRYASGGAPTVLANHCANAARDSPGQAMGIAVYGAGGFTGRLTVAEVRRRGFTPVLVGRDKERLRAAAVEAEVPGAEIRVAGLDSPGALADAFGDCAVVINCAGPFTL